MARDDETEDAALILLRFANGARGAVAISQVSAGRKNRSSGRSAARPRPRRGTREKPDQLWIGHRDEPNQILLRDPALMNAAGPRGGEPAGRPRGGLRRHVPRAVPRHLRRRRRGRAAPSGRPTPRSRTATRRCSSATPSRPAPARAAGSASIAAASSSGGCRHETRVPDRALPRDAADGGGRLGRRRGFEVLEIACWPAAAGPTRRYAGTTHIDVATCPRAGAGDPRGDRGQGPDASPGSATTPTRCTRTRRTATPAIGHLKGDRGRGAGWTCRS